MRFWEQRQILHVGAEAEVSDGSWLGLEAIRKVRRRRRWRHPDLDARLTRSRMSAEARLLTRLSQSGSQVPTLLDLDLAGATMVMTRVPGKPMIELLRGAGDEITEVGWSTRMLREVGAAVRHLHRVGVAHGDLSTNNLLWCAQEGASIIDFGLAVITEEIEQFGIDLHVMHEILGASHPDHENAIDEVVSGYVQVDQGLGRPPASGGGDLPTAQEVVSRFQDIQTRVRYHG